MTRVYAAFLFLTRTSILAVWLLGFQMGVALVYLFDGNWVGAVMALILAVLAFFYIVRHITVEVTA